MSFHNELDDLFGSKVKVKIIRAMFNFPTKAYTSRELARFIGVSHTPVLKSVKDLQNMNIVTIERHGTAHILRLNKKHHFYKIIESLFKEEKNALSALKKIFNNIDNIDAIAIFGSTAKGEEKIESDIDLFVITKNKKEILDKIAEKQKEIFELFGKNTIPYIISPEEYKRKKNTPLIQNIIKNHILVKGERLG